MRRFAFAVVALMILTTASLAQPPAPPTGNPPMINLAKATKKGKTVVVQVSMLAPQTFAKEVNGQTMNYSRIVWQNSKSFVLGKTVKAVRTDGEPATPAQVLKALAKPTGTACFVRGQGEPQPDPFYLDVLRRGSVVLILDAQVVFPPADPAYAPKALNPPKAGNPDR